MTIHNFAESLLRSHSYADAPWWEEVYRSYFGDRFESMQDMRGDGWWQKAGIDRFVSLSNGRRISVDEKVREKDWEDILLEYDSTGSYDGWMVKPLGCDYIAYAFAPSRRCFLLPYDQLKAAWQANKAQWYAECRTVEAPNERYITRSLAVPIPVLMSAMTDAVLVRWTA